MEKFDGVVIGAGHNGLTLAAYLALAGLKVAVVERNPHIGGGCTTQEPALPGYRFNLHSNFFMGLRHSPLIRDLELYRFGFSYIEPPIQQAKEFLSHAQHDLFSVVRKHFEDDRIRTLFTSYMHVITTESVPGAGIVFPLIFANVMEFTLPVGGSASFTDALARVIEVCGGSVITAADVKEIVVRNGRATAVRLADGGALEGSRFIASAIDAPTTIRMAGEDLFPEDVRKKLNGWHWGNHSLVTLHLALRDKPVYHCADFDSDINRAFNIFFGMDDIEQVRSCFDDCAADKFPHVLMGNGACNSAVDTTYAPTNGHSAFWWPFAPYAVDGDQDNWDRQRDDYTERVLDVWREYAANLDDGNVRAKLLFTPLDIERLNANMVRGAVRMGAYIPSQLGINRPHPLLSGTRTPIEGLYLCGSSTGNGGGINGAPGYIAANAIADDLQLERPWARVPAPEWRH